jgi:hypothetical protein
MMDPRIKELVEQAGFRVFGDKIVAADQGSSGLATDCSQRLIELVVRECIHTVEHHGGMCGATSGRRLRDRFELKD